MTLQLVNAQVVTTQPGFQGYQVDKNQAIFMDNGRIQNISNQTKIAPIITQQ